MPKVGSNLKEQTDNTSIRFGYNSNFCQKCGAWKGELGLEPTFNLYIKHLCDIFDEVKRVLKPTGSCWVNIGDSYYNDSTVRTAGKEAFLRKGDCGYDQYLRKDVPINERKTHRKNFANRELPTKCLCDIPFRFSIEMINRGWIKRNTVI